MLQNAPNAKQTLTDGQDTTKSYINATDLTPGHKLYQNASKRYKQTLTDGQDTNNRLQKMLLTRLAPSR